MSFCWEGKLSKIATVSFPNKHGGHFSIHFWLHTRTRGEYLTQNLRRSIKSIHSFSFKTDKIYTILNWQVIFQSLRDKKNLHFLGLAWCSYIFALNSQGFQKAKAIQIVNIPEQMLYLNNHSPWKLNSYQYHICEVAIKLIS